MIMMGMVPLGTVTLVGKAETVGTSVQQDFRMRRLMIRARNGAPRTWWMRLLGLFWWLRVPWLVRRWDDDREQERRRVLVVRPAGVLLDWLDRRAQRKALSECYITAINVDHRGGGRTELLMHRLDVLSLAETGLDVPPCQAGCRIEVTLDGVGGWLRWVRCARRAPFRPEVHVPSDP